MEKIIKSREILEFVKAELSKLEQKLNEFSAVNLSESFVPIDLCTSAAMTLQKLSAYEESLFEKIAEFSDAEVVTLDDAERIIKEAEAEVERKLLVKKLSGIKTSNPKYDSLIEQLRTAAVGEDLSTPERTIAEMLISDLLNNTTETSKNELVENSNYYKLAFAFNRSELFYENPDLTPDNSGGGEAAPQSTEPAPEQSSENQGESENSPEEPAENEPPPDPYSEESHKDEIFLDIDLDREEDFSEEKAIDLDLSIPIEDENHSFEEENTEESEQESEDETGLSLKKEESASEEENDTVSEETISEDNESITETEVSPNEEAESQEPPEAEAEVEIEEASEESPFAAPEVEISEQIQPIVDEYKDYFVENPNELALNISESPEVNTKHNVTEIMNMLSPKGRSARSPVKVYQVIMSELLLYGPKTEDDLYELPDFLKNRISNSVVDGYLEKLYNKGLISRINYDGNVLYYFTKKGLKFNNHDKMISNFYCCSDKRMRSSVTKRDCRKVYPISNISVCSSVILSRIVKKYPYYLAIGSSDISVEGLSISVISKPNVRNFALAYVSDDAAKLDKLYENLNRSLKALNVFDKLTTLIIGSFTRPQSEAVYKIVQKSWGEKLVSTKIILYSYVADKYFDPSTFEEVTDFDDTDAAEITPTETSPVEEGAEE